MGLEAEGQTEPTNVVDALALMLNLVPRVSTTIDYTLHAHALSPGSRSDIIGRRTTVASEEGDPLSPHARCDVVSMLYHKALALALCEF